MMMKMKTLNFRYYTEYAKKKGKLTDPTKDQPNPRPKPKKVKKKKILGKLIK